MVNCVSKDKILNSMVNCLSTPPKVLSFRDLPKIVVYSLVCTNIFDSVSIDQKCETDLIMIVQTFYFYMAERFMSYQTW